MIEHRALAGDAKAAALLDEAVLRAADERVRVPVSEAGFRLHEHAFIGAFEKCGLRDGASNRAVERDVLERPRSGVT